MLTGGPYLCDYRKFRNIFNIDFTYLACPLSAQRIVKSQSYENYLRLLLSLTKLINYIGKNRKIG